MTHIDSSFEHLETAVVHAGAPDPPIEGAVVTPLFQSANYVMRDESTYDALRYIRLSNSPSHVTLQARLAAIEGGEAALVTASGMAAISTALLAVAGGAHVLAQRTLYGGTSSFLAHDAPRLGLTSTAVDVACPDAWAAARTEATRAFYVEAISNPLMEVGDLRAVVAFCRAHGLVSIIDATFATPVNLRPLSLGFDLVVHSATKYLNGHSDLVAGCVVGSAALVDRVRALLLHLGGSADPHACFLLERGLKTLVLRVERHNANAARLAEHLAAHPAVQQVHYPGLADDPSHGRARELLSGFGGMLALRTDTPARAERFLERVRIALHAPSLGGPETLVVRPSRSSHLGLSDAERAAATITDRLIRVSVGIEHIDALIADFDQALAD